MSRLSNWFPAIAQNLVASALWSGGALGLTTLTVWLAKMTPAVAAYAPLSYLFAALLALLVIAWGAVGVAAYRQRTRDESPVPEPYDDRELRESVESSSEILAAFVTDARGLMTRMSAIEDLNRAIVEDYQRMLGLEARFSNMLDRLKGAVQRQHETINANHAALQEKVALVDATRAAEVAGVYEQVDKLRREYLAHHSLNADTLRHRFDNIYSSLAAIWHRERLHFLGSQIESVAGELAAPTQAGTHYDETTWEIWEANEASWRNTVLTWCGIAESYVPGISERVLTSSDDHYRQKGVAKVGQFPDPEAYIAYKAFCAVWKNWCGWKDEAQRAVHQVAFNGHVDSPRPAPPSADDREVEEAAA